MQDDEFELISFDFDGQDDDDSDNELAFPEPPSTEQAFVQIQRVSRLNDPLVEAAKKEQAHELYERANDLVKQALSSQPVSRIKLVRALPLFNDAITILPKWDAPYMAIAWIAWQHHHHDVAVRFLKTLLDVNPFALRAEALLKEIEADYVKEQVSDKVSQQARRALNQE